MTLGAPRTGDVRGAKLENFGRDRAPSAVHGDGLLEAFDARPSWNSGPSSRKPRGGVRHSGSESTPGAARHQNRGDRAGGSRSAGTSGRGRPSPAYRRQ